MLTAPDKLPLDGIEPPPGDLTTRLSTSELAREYLRLLRPRNLFAYGLTTVDARIAHRALRQDGTAIGPCDHSFTNE